MGRESASHESLSVERELGRLWDYVYEGAMLRYLQSWIDQLRWQGLAPMEKRAIWAAPVAPGATRRREYV
jgi:hypothetical protein